MIVNIHIEPLQILWLQDSSSTSHELQYRAFYIKQMGREEYKKIDTIKMLVRLNLSNLMIQILFY